MSRWRPHRGVLTVLGLVAAAIYVALGLSRITLDVDVTRLLPPGLKESAGYRLFLQNFAGADELMITLEGAAPEAVEAVAAELDRVLRRGPSPLARRVVSRSPFDMESPAPHSTPAGTKGGQATSSPDDRIELLAWGLLNQPAARLEALEAQLSPDQLAGTLADSLSSLATSIDGMDRLMGYDPLGLTTPMLGGSDDPRSLAPSMASPDGRFRLIHVESAWPLPHYQAAGEWLAAVRAAAVAVAAPRSVEVRLTGEPAFVSEISRSMERDMKRSGGWALALICLVVWLGYRDWRLLPLLAGCVLVIFLLTIATAGLVNGRLTVLTVGCGSILIGLTVDYGVLMYAARGAADARAAARRTRRGILWAATTTAASFAALMLAGLPGLAELGLLVTVGVLMGAGMFLGLYPRWLESLKISPLMRSRRERSQPEAGVVAPEPGASAGSDQPSTRAVGDPWLPAAAAVVVVAGMAGLIVRGAPVVDLDSGSLRPRVSEAYDTLDRLSAHLGGGEQSLSVLVTGRDESEVAARLEALDGELRELQNDGVLGSYALPLALWPSPARQQENLQGAAGRLARDSERLRTGVLAAGFSDEAFTLADQIFAQWRDWADRPVDSMADRAFWPEGPAARWLLARFAVTDAAGGDPLVRSLCLGVIRPRVNPPDERTMAALSALQTDGVYLAGSKLIGRVLEEHLSRGFFWLAVIFGAVTLGLLGVALRRLPFILLAGGGLAVAFGTLIGAMAWIGLGWNAFTLPALLLSLGTGSDYFIYVILELQEHGSVARLRARLARPLLVCVGASACGFGSLAWAGNLGLSNLGRVCALALAINLLVALVLMPWVWQRVRAAAHRHTVSE